MIGKTISHYRIIEKIGEGGMGVVYRAEDLKLKRTVAIKFLSDSAIGNRESLTRFIREAQAAAALDHPNICPVYEICDTEKQVFIVMPCLEGWTLKERIESGTLSVEESIDVAIQIASGLKEAHEHGIIHRDIKPENITICRKNQVKITDFGLAKTPETVNVTIPGVIMGTTPYMSPEQAQGRETDHRTDIWSLGVILYECLAGRHPFGGEYAQAIIYSIVSEEPEPVSKLSPEVPDELELIVGKMMAKDPDERYSDAGEVVADLELVLESMRGDRVDQGAHGRRGLRGRPLRKQPLLYAAVIAVAVALIVIFLSTYHPRNALSFAKRDWLLITSVGNMTGEEVFEKVLNEAISIDIQQSRWVNIFDRKRIERTLKRMQRAGVEKIDESLGLEICKREGIKAMLVPRITRLGDTYSLSAYIVDVATGNRLSPIRITVKGRDEVLKTAVDRLTRKIRNNLGESLLSIVRNDKSLPKVTTCSLEALEQFALGLEKTRRPVDWGEIKIFFENAIGLDSTFAYAYAALGTICDNNMEYEEAKKYYSMAVKYIDNLTDREKYRILAEYYIIVENDPRKAIKSYKALINMYPDAISAYNNLGYTFFRIGMLEEALHSYEQALRIDPGFILALNNISNVYLKMEDFDRVIETGRRIIEIDPSYSMGYLSLGRGYNGKHMYDEAIKALTRADALSPDNTWIHLHLGRAYRGKGMYEEAIRALKKSIKMYPGNFFAVADMAKTYALMRDREKALSIFEKLEGMGRYCNRLYDEACVFALLGEKEEAMKRFERAVEEGLRYEYFRDYEIEVKLISTEPRFKELVGEMKARQERI